MSKRRWWEKDEQFKEVHRKLRLNYDKALQDAEDRIKADYEKRLKSIQTRHLLDLEERDKQSAKLAKEIARVTLEFGPSSYGRNRFVMYAQMDERFMLHSRDLKEIGPYVVQCLGHMIQREFAKIDFDRAQPVMPSSWETRKDPPRWRIVPGEGEIA